MRFKLVIFDMDGTLVQEMLDFAAIRREIGLPAGQPILEEIVKLPEIEQRRAHEILHRHEMAAADACVLHPGAVELLHTLRMRGIKTALLTRNSAACTQRVLGQHQLVLDLVATRENLPHKPHPDSILNITGHLGILPRQTLMVGDYLYDLQAAASAGVESVLLCMGGRRPEFAGQATWCIESLLDLLPLVGIGGAGQMKKG